MNHIIKNILSAAALSACLVSGVQAKNILVPLALGSGTYQSGSFSDTVAAGGNFTDNFIFQSPPPNASMLFTGTAGTGIVFTDVLLFIFGTVTTEPLIGSFSDGSFSFTEPSLPSASYALRVTGEAIAGSKFTGTISGTSFSTVAPVPEPANWALLTIGLGVIGVVTRRKRAVRCSTTKSGLHPTLLGGDGSVLTRVPRLPFGESLQA